MSPGTNRMNRGPSKRSGELLSRTRDHRARLLPTKHRLAALPPATREYQSDSSSKRPGAVVLFPLPPENSPPKSAALDAGSLHIRREKQLATRMRFRIASLAPGRATRSSPPAAASCRFPSSSLCLDRWPRAQRQNRKASIEGKRLATLLRFSIASVASRRANRSSPSAAASCLSLSESLLLTLLLTLALS